MQGSDINNSFKLNSASNHLCRLSIVKSITVGAYIPTVSVMPFDPKILLGSWERGEVYVLSIIEVNKIVIYYRGAVFKK